MTMTATLSVAPTTAAKFASDGAPRRFPGLSVVAEVSGAAVRSKLSQLTATIAAEPDAAAHAFMSEASMHMTLCRVLNDARRLPAEWPAGLAIDSTLDSAAEVLAGKLSQISVPAVFRLRARRIFINATGEIQIQVVGYDRRNDDDLHAARRKIAAAAGRPLPDPPPPFHITLSYRVRPTDAATENRLADRIAELFDAATGPLGDFEIRHPALCSYVDMTRFTPRLRLG